MTKLHRRAVLKGLGLSGLPWYLPSLYPGRAHAAAPPKRIIFYYVGQGNIYGSWHMNRQNIDDKMDWEIPLDAGGPEGWSEILRPLHPWRKNLLVLDGLDCTPAVVMAGGHEVGQLGALTGSTKPSVSVDQVIANGIKVPGRLSSLELAIHNTNNINYSLQGTVLPSANNPSEVWDRVFKGRGTPASGMASTPEKTDAARLAEEQAAITAFARERFTRLATKVGGEDRRKLEAHRDLLRDLEAAVMPGAGSAGGKVDCSMPPARPKTEGFPFSPHDKYYDFRFKSWMDMVTAAFVCDLTRVVTLQMWELPNEYIGVPSGVDMHNEYHHDIDNKRRPDSTGVVTRYNVKAAEMYGKILAALAATPDGTGTLLDSTLVVYVREIASGDHRPYRYPIVIGGDAQGYFRTGRYVHYGRTTPSVFPRIKDSPDHPKLIGPPYNKLLVSLCRSMGLDTKSVGPESYTAGMTGEKIDATGPLPRLSSKDA